MGAVRYVHHFRFFTSIYNCDKFVNYAMQQTLLNTVEFSLKRLKPDISIQIL
jgi:hypothetical protein